MDRWAVPQMWSATGPHVLEWRSDIQEAFLSLGRALICWHHFSLSPAKPIPAPDPLNSFIQFSCEIGICEREMIDLLKPDVHMTEEADEWGHHGYVHIRNGKTEFRKRSLPITARARGILTMWMAKSKTDLVFTREDGVSPVSPFTLIQQQERMRVLLNLPWDACVHSARHTALTNLGLTGVDTFTLQRAAGHANIDTTRKYVHPTPPTMKDAFQRKVRNERRDRRATRKHVAKVVLMPP